MAEITSTTETSYDYSMIGSFGSEATQSLNGDMINKIRAAEEKAVIDPIDERLSNIELESEKIDEIQSKINEFMDVMDSFYLYSSGTNVFDQISASTTGDSVIFDAVNISDLENGVTSVSVSQLAQKDVYQTTGFTDPDALVNGGQDAGDTLSIEIGGVQHDFSTVGKTYTELASEIDQIEGIDASVEQVGDNEYKLVIKSTETGTTNSLNITETGINLGLTEDLNGDGNPDGRVLAAQNSIVTVDGITYNTSSNTVTVDGNLKITATKLGDASLSIEKDYSSLSTAFDAMAAKYNELVDMVNEEIYSSDTVISDKSSLRNILSTVKDLFFQQYGADTPTFGSQVDEYGDIVYDYSNVTNNDKSIFNYGFSFDKDGYMVIDSAILNDAIADNPEELRKIFVGSAENEGLGTLLKETLDDFDSYNGGLITSYLDSMTSRKEKLEEDRESAIDTLDAKYGLMAQQFTEYASIIAQMEASFSGLQMMIAQSTASD